MSDKKLLVTPVGRLVQGGPFEKNEKDHLGNPLVYTSGTKVGQPKIEYYCGIAIEKTNPEWPAFYQEIVAVGNVEFPQLFAGGKVPPLTNAFSWKMIDGDGLDSKGEPYAKREGFAGCWILRYSTGYAPGVFDNSIPVKQLIDGVKRGDYVRILGTIQGNKPSPTPGFYMNLSTLQRIGFGPEIFSGPNASAVLGETQVGYIPAGASQVPVANAAGVPGVATPPVAATPPVNTAPVVPTLPGAPTPPVVPNTDVLSVPAVVTPPVAVVPPVVTPTPSLTPELIAKGHTYEALKGQFTDEQMRTAGWLVDLPF